MIQITTRYFCAGVVVENNRVIRAAPILAWAIGGEWPVLRRWVLARSGRVEVVSTDRQG